MIILNFFFFCKKPIQTITLHPFQIIQILFHLCDPKQYDKLASSILSCSIYTGQEMTLLNYFVEKEIQETSQTAVLFRSNSVALRLISSYTKLISPHYLKGILEKLFLKVFEDAKKYEVIVEKLSDPRKLEENRKNLFSISNLFLDVILASSNSVPTGLKKISCFVYRLVENKFQNFGVIALGGIFFLRLVCPSIVSPQNYNVLTGYF